MLTCSGLSRSFEYADTKFFIVLDMYVLLFVFFFSEQIFITIDVCLLPTFLLFVIVMT